MSGPVVLMGGDEFRPPCLEMDRALLALLPRQPPRVVVLPTAAMERPDLAAENGVRHFAALGAEAAAAMILDRAGAEEAERVRQLLEADLVYLAGGSPRHLLSTLKGTAAWEALLLLHERGATIAGSSAGAMVLGGYLYSSETGLVEALGLLPQAAILPHHERATPERAGSFRQTLDPSISILGIDGATAAVRMEGSWRVFGVGRVTLYSQEGTAIYTAGQSFHLPELPS